MLKSPAVYIHIPFCEVKCGYCDFYSVPRGWKEFDLQEAYVEALCREIESRCDRDRTRPVTSIFFGGGTPSLLRTDLLEKILNKLNEHFTWDTKTEVTMECNPKTIDLEGLRQRRELGINRLSLGVQSFQDRLLKVMGRIHSADEARHTIEAAFKAGFENVNFDMIFALPGQTLEDWQMDLETALQLGTPHLSCYNLTIETGTPFEKIYGSGSGLPPDDTALAMFRHTRERLAAAGLNAYEISNFAKPGHECVHNQNYWKYGEYLGFGVSAASFACGTRTMNIRDLNRYIEANFEPEVDKIDKQTAMGEFVMLSLRTRDGLSEQRFEELFGEPFVEAFDEKLQRVGEYLQRHDTHWHLTTRGLELADSVIGEFI